MCPSCLSAQIPLPRENLTELTVQLCTFILPAADAPNHSHGPRSVCLQISSAFAKCLKRVPVTDWSPDFGQAWALGKGAHASSCNVPTPSTWNTLTAHSLTQPKLPSGPLGLSDAQTHICALGMHDGSSLRPGLMAEPWGPRTLLTGTGKAGTEQWRGSGHLAQSVQVWSKYC